MLATKLIQNRWKAAGMMATGIVLTMVACESRLPQDVAQEQETRLDERPILDEQAAVRELLPTPREGDSVSGAPRVLIDRLQPTQRVGRNILNEEYPALLRKAGIEGTIALRLHVTNGGEADQVEVVKSSGHEALDQAAVRVVKRMQWGHDGPGKTTDYWTTTSITFADRAQGMKMRTKQRQEPLREEGVSLPRKVDPDGEPHFTPYTKNPELRNREVVGTALVRSYPPLLRDAGIGGTVLTWILIDENGRVVNAKVRESSGRRELDGAAVQVARIMEFKPAEHNGMPVNVWISLPIVFKTQ